MYPRNAQNIANPIILIIPKQAYGKSRFFIWDKGDAKKDPSFSINTYIVLTSTESIISIVMEE